MGNHIHLVIQVSDVALPKIMQNVAFRYTHWINKRNGRSGHLFQGRYQAILVDADSYLLELVRYVHLNPVRAGLVKNPLDYAWSGHRAYLGKETLPWLCSEWVLGQFAKRLNKCRKRYQAFVNAGVGEGYREDFHRGGEDRRVLADERFLARMQEYPPRGLHKVALADIARQVANHHRLGIKELTSPSRRRQLAGARAEIGWLARHFEVASATETAAYFNREASVLCRQIAKVESQARTDSATKARLDAHINALMQA
jgi:hypothetical protein